jgi:hypothetical protein
MIFERILDVFKSGGKSKAPAFVPPDPANEFPHPENQTLFARLKESSRVAAPTKIPYGQLADTRFALILTSFRFCMTSSMTAKSGRAQHTVDR